MLESNPIPSPTITRVENPEAQSADVLVVGLFADGALSPTMKRIDASNGGWLKRLVELGQLRGKRGELTLLASPDTTAGPIMILVVGLGDDPVRRAVAFDLAAAAVRTLADRDRDRVIIALGECVAESDCDSLVAGALHGCEGQGLYQSAPTFHAPTQIQFSQVSAESIERGTLIGESINHTRRLVNEPAAIVYPESFAKRAESLAADSGLAIEIWDAEKLRDECCRSMIAVGGGSSKPPCLVILRHHGAADQAPLALVGKGVTFDSGGLSLKPTDGMVTMKCDMAGAATVVGVMNAVARLGIRKNVVGICGLVENMVSGDSYKLGDVIETRSGKTIEILNTDAEGRVVLADTLDVAIEQKPRAMVDLATLTGACMVALGTEVAGLMTNDQKLCDAIAKAAGEEGEPVWQLPMFDSFDDLIKSKVADIRNTGGTRHGGAITAAKFLENFVDDVPWVHIDIAGPAFADSSKSSRDAGATGAMVRSLINWIENY